MALLVFQHVAEEDAARLGQILAGYGHRLRVIRLFAGDPVPPDLDDVDGIVSMGGPMNVDEQDQHAWMADELAMIKAAHAAHLPIIGVCLGAQLIATALGGQVGPMDSPEVGWHPVTQAFPGTIEPVLAGIPWTTPQFHVHGQEVKDLPPGSTPLAGSEACRTQAFKVGLTTFGFQYHFEWERPEIDFFAKDDFVTGAGGDPNAIFHDSDRYFDEYRRLGDRLCDRLALLVFPIDKR